MGKKNRKKKAQQPAKPGRTSLWIAVTLVGAAGIAFALFRGSGAETDQNASTQIILQEKRTQPAPRTSTKPQNPPQMSHPQGDFHMPPYLEDPSSVQLPPTMSPSSVGPAAQQAYYIAGEKPEMLAQLPCFCYCDRFGHTSLHTCFVTDHAEQCDICLKEALEANILLQEGMSIPEIRELIVAKYAPKDGHSH